jgi:hypothetical protein
MSLRILARSAVVAAALSLLGCATHREHGTAMGGGHGRMDMAQMCAMHRQMTAGKSPAEQQAAIEDHIRSRHGSVDPEMVAKHRKMMEMRCAESAPSPEGK